ncbi:hypothetical protein A3J41_00650 [candidate division TM6 bacterium RIFCSPHIGHO2_12_FULL_38_8]|nr:MAG: hypothetical protein A3J41_00650 [candidate division TM6 bacterium RIFCSPHIGHO2_12_FULL_38_8]
MKKKISAEMMAEKFKVTDEKVKEAVQRLIETYKPLYIYTFGSYAKGQSDLESDFDVMVVIDQFDDTPWAVTSRGYLKLGSLLMPVDLLVYDKTKFEVCKNDKTTFCYKIVKTGRLLYERK